MSALSEFELIQRYFLPLQGDDASLKRGIGDDCAVIAQAAEADLLISCDTLVEGTHFLPATAAADIGYRALATSVSDLAASGAQPQWFTLALTCPQANAKWMAEFAGGLSLAASESAINLIGGDTTRGPLAVTIQVAGTVPTDAAILRSGAKPGQKLAVSGYLGDAAQGLVNIKHSKATPLVSEFLRPQSRTQLGVALRNLATAMIDVSDGLLADAHHIAENSGVCLKLYSEQLPLSPHLLAQVDPLQAVQLALTGGDDYELLFSFDASQESLLLDLSERFGVLVTVIGEVVSGKGCQLDDQFVEAKGYRHF